MNVAEEFQLANGPLEGGNVQCWPAKLWNIVNGDRAGGAGRVKR
jgi:hypothetical protein